MSRPTIADIARECGISASAVSYALNGNPGVSDATRAQIIATAERLGWHPNAAARALSSARADAVGLVIAAPFSDIHRDTFYLELIAGIEVFLAQRPTALVLKLVETLADELAVLRRWRAQHRVDGVLLVNPRQRDPRPALVAGLGLPAVFVGEPANRSTSAYVGIDDAAATRLLLTDLRGLGYRHIGAVLTATPFAHTATRRAVLHQAADQELQATVVEVPAGAGEEWARSAVRRLLRETRPDVLLCENQALTLAALSALDDEGLGMPDDVGLVSWEPVPALIHRAPTISSLDRDPRAFGSAAVELLAGRLAGGTVRTVTLDAPRLVVRNSLRSMFTPYSAG